MQQAYGPHRPAAALDAAARKADAHSSCAAAVPNPMLACMHAQQEMLQQHLLPIMRHMAHMQRTTAALHHRMEHLPAFGG